MDEQEIINKKIEMLHEKQDEIIRSLNEVIERINQIPKSIKDDKERLMKKTFYLERDIERLKYRMNMPDEEI